VVSLGYDAFYGCNYLTDVTIPIGMTSIGSWAFGNCTKLANIEISSSVINIKESAFRFCSSLNEITIPNNVINIGAWIFGGCTGLTSVVFQDKTLEQVQNIEDENDVKRYPWGISDTSIISVA
jgi:hypothetical protein